MQALFAAPPVTMPKAMKAAAPSLKAMKAMKAAAPSPKAMKDESHEEDNNFRNLVFFV